MKPETRGKKLHIEVRLWPTPKATLRGDCISERNRHSPDKDGGGAKSCMNVPVNGLLGRAIHQKDNPQPGQLNPTFVEWLMGYPCGHTELSLSEMQSFRKSRSKSLKQSRKQNETNP